MTPAMPSQRTLVLSLSALTALGPLSLDMYLPGLPDLSRDLGTSASLAQLTLTACMIGLAAGQLVAGPASDARGRRGPLLAGIALYAVASALCALSPSIWFLIPLRFVQGAAGAAGIVIARAIVRDLHAGGAAARFYALLTAVSGAAPIVAPVVGGQLLGLTDWRGIFWLLAATGVGLFLIGWRLVPETLAPAERHAGGLRATTRVFGLLARDRSFAGYALTAGFSAGMMFCYLAASPFVLQEIHGLSPQLFSVVFAVNAFGIIVGAQVSSRLVGRLGARRLVAAGLTVGCGGAGVLLLSVVLGAGLVVVLPALFAIVAHVGLAAPNATALALSRHERNAGSASALLGLSTFAIGGLCAPLVGVGGSGTAVPLALATALLAVAAVVSFRAVVVTPRA